MVFFARLFAAKLNATVPIQWYIWLKPCVFGHRTPHHTPYINSQRRKISLSVHRVHFIRYLQNCILYHSAKRNATSECAVVFYSTQSPRETSFKRKETSERVFREISHYFRASA